MFPQDDVRGRTSGRTRRLAALMVAGLLSGAPAHAEQGTIVAVGASNTSGWGIGTAAAYPARLETRLRACRHDVRVVNAGVPFDTTAGMLARIDRDVPDGTKTVIIQPGGNDRRFFVSRKQRAANIEAMRARLAARGIPAIVYDPDFPPEAYQWDRIHLTAERHALIATELAPQVLRVLGRSAQLKGAGCAGS